MSAPSPLHDVHTALGATFTDFAGWSMPVRYSSELAEHKAVRATAGMFDLSHMAEIEVTGPRSGEMLDYAFVGNFANLTTGRARYSMLCDADGGVLDDLVTYRLAEERYLVVANAANAAVVSAALAERAESFDAEVRDRSAEYALIAVQGPSAAMILEAVTDAELSALKYYGIEPATVGGYDVLLARTGYTGEDGFELYCSPDRAPQLWQVLTEAGSRRDLVPAGLACRDTLRLEAGMPLYGNELSLRRTPFEANLGRLVKFDKDVDFVGRAALVKHRDNPAETVLVGLRGSGRRAPRHGYRVLSEDNQVGEITSGALSPTLGYPIAMAYVARSVSEPGTSLAVDVRGKSQPVEVVALPFYKR